MKAWKDAKKEHVTSYQKKWREENADSVKAYNQVYQPAYQSKTENQFATWMRSLRRNYRMTPDQFNALWESQDGKCAICHVAMLPRGRNPNAACVDHNHETKEVRGLLCRACNHGIGNLKDSPEVLRSAMEYLLEKGHYSDHKLQKGKTS